MTIRVGILCASVGVSLLCTAPAIAELDVAERKFVRSCMEALASPSDRLRVSAAASLVQMGADGVSAIVANADMVKSDAGWDTLRDALVRIGEPAAKELERSRARWPAGSAKRLEAALEATQQSLTVSPPDVAKKVDDTLQSFRGGNSFSDSDPRVRRLVLLGRQAVPALLAALERMAEPPPAPPAEAEPVGDAPPGFGLGEFGSRSAALAALESLATDADVPRLARLLDLGMAEASAVLAKIGTRPAVDAILSAVARDEMDFSIGRALESVRQDPRVGTAVCDWVTRNAKRDDHTMAAAADFLADSDDPGAAIVLLAALPNCREGQTVKCVGIALANLGRKEGIEALVDLVTGALDTSHIWPMTAAAEKLNEIAGRPIYTGSNRWREGMDEQNARAVTEAAPAFRKWWDSAKATLRYDPKTRKWRS